MKTRWILVADASRARFFREDPKERTFEQIGAFDHEASRAKVRDLMADANGRKPVGPSMSAGHLAHGRPGAEPDTDAKSVEAEKFARELADYIESGVLAHAFESLVLVAPPHFLGLLRAQLGKEAPRHVETTIDKDLTMFDLRDIEQRMQTFLAAA